MAMTSRSLLAVKVPWLRCPLVANASNVNSGTFPQSSARLLLAPKKLEKPRKRPRIAVILAERTVISVASLPSSARRKQSYVSYHVPKCTAETLVLSLLHLVISHKRTRVRVLYGRFELTYCANVTSVKTTRRQTGHERPP